MSEKISFKNDYSEGCHPKILEALAANNLSQQESYGHDEFSLEAKLIIRNLCQSPTATVHFVSGGTQANLIVSSALLRPHESIISAATGHIYNNEAGAIEATGHKISSIATPNGKLQIEHIASVLEGHERAPHQLKPRLVYISNSTELGTVYTKTELSLLSDYCRKNNLILFMDGARLGQALCIENGDVSLSDIAELVDIFYIGGTKNGALLGEAIVIPNPALQSDFDFIIKQKGALLSKGRIIGIQFLELFRNDLFFELAAYANQQAMKIKSAFSDVGCDFLVETFTNQIFPVLQTSQIETLFADFEFYEWKKINDRSSAVRIICSWATNQQHVNLFVEAIKNLKK